MELVCGWMVGVRGWWSVRVGGERVECWMRGEGMMYGATCSSIARSKRSHILITLYTHHTIYASHLQLDRPLEKEPNVTSHEVIIDHREEEKRLLHLVKQLTGRVLVVVDRKPRVPCGEGLV
jgi:hypothetical protein